MTAAQLATVDPLPMVAQLVMVVLLPTSVRHRRASWWKILASLMSPPYSSLRWPTTLASLTSVRHQPDRIRDRIRASLTTVQAVNPVSASAIDQSTMAVR